MNRAAESHSGFAERHAGMIVLLALLLAAAGIVAGLGLPVGLFPQVAFPRVVVDLDAGSRPADQTALLLTRPVEEAVRAVPGVQTVRSETARGSAQISVDFGWGRDMVAGTLLVHAAIAQIMPQLPAGTAYDVRRMDPTVYPIIGYALVPDTNPTSPGSATDGPAGSVALRDLAQYDITPLLSGIPGLARVAVQGGDTREIEVLADPHRLAEYGLALTDLATMLSANNVLRAVGQIQDRERLSLVLADHTMAGSDGVAAVADTIVKSDAAGMVRLRDVATVRSGVVPQWQRVLEDGRPAVLFSVYEQPDGNAVSIAGAVKAALAKVALPPGVRLVNWYDQSELVTQAASSVRDAIGIGLVLAAAVLFAFLRSWRITLVAMVVVPATLAASLLALSLFGMSLNVMTLGGMAASVGLLIDDVIVMIEHIARRAGGSGGDSGRESGRVSGGHSGRSAVLPAAREFLAPLTGSSLATLIVFLPLGLLTGVTGAFSKALSVTMASALVVSWALTAFLVPILARRFVQFDAEHGHADTPPAQDGVLARMHLALLSGAFRHRWLLAAGLLPLLAAGWFAAQSVPTGFMPAVDEGGFILDYYTKPGTSLTETERQIAQVDALLRATPDVATFSRRLGTGLGNDLGQSYHGDYFVRLKPGHTSPAPEIMASVQARILHDVPGVEVELAQLMEDLVGDLTAVPQPIEVKLYASDPAALPPLAEKIATTIKTVPGLVSVKSGLQIAGDAIDLRIDPVKTALEGVSPNDVSQAVETALTGTVATQLPSAAKFIGVRVRLPDALRLRTEGLAALPIRAPDGHVFPLNRVATLAVLTGQPQIARENLQAMVAVTGRIEGRGMGAAVADVRALLDKPGFLPPGVRYQMGGLYQQQQIAFAGLARVFLAALSAEFILLLFLYRRFWLAFAIIACALLSTVAVFIGLWATGIDLNITALMGLTMVVGIGAEMAIFYVSEVVVLAEHMDGADALREASRNRLRPITMTALAAILTLLPLALGIGQGSGMQQPLAIAIISGLLLQYPLVLIVLPVLIGLSPPRSQGELA